MNIPQELLNELVNLPCCRIDIGSYRSLSIGLGEKCKNVHKNSRVDYYGEWEFGTYNAAWRIIKNGQIVLGSSNIIDDTQLETQKLIPLFKERLICISHLSEFDVRFEFSNSLIIDFMGCINDDDEVLHILHIDGCYWELTKTYQWHYGRNVLPSQRN